MPSLGPISTGPLSVSFSNQFQAFPLFTHSTLFSEAGLGWALGGVSKAESVPCGSLYASGTERRTNRLSGQDDEIIPGNRTENSDIKEGRSGGGISKKRGSMLCQTLGKAHQELDVWEAEKSPRGGREPAGRGRSFSGLCCCHHRAGTTDMPSKSGLVGTTQIPWVGF